MAWPCLPRFRIPETPCSPRLCLVVSRSWLVQSPVLLPDVGSALPDFDTCLDSLPYPYGEFVTVLCLRSHHCLTVSGSTGQWCPMVRNWECGRFLLCLPIRVPPCLPLGLATLWLGRCIPVSGSTGQLYPWMMYSVVCGCSSHPAVTLRVDGSLGMWPIRSSQGVPTTG